jgi:hypothetical protein
MQGLCAMLCARALAWGWLRGGLGLDFHTTTTTNTTIHWFGRRGSDGVCKIHYRDDAGRGPEHHPARAACRNGYATSRDIRRIRRA